MERELGVRVAYMFIRWKAGRPDFACTRVLVARDLLVHV